MPVLVTKRDFHAAADAISTAVSNAQATVIADAGHLAPLENRAAFPSVLLKFLR